MDFRDELGEIVLPDKVLVPAPFESNCRDVDALAATSFMSIYGQAQLTLRAMCEDRGIWGHAMRQEFAERVMDLVDPYLLCRQGLRSAYGPDELLKMMYLLGLIDANEHRPVVEIDVHKALSPYELEAEERPYPVPLNHPNYWKWRGKDEHADNAWWRQKRSMYSDLRIAIFGLQQRFMKAKYGSYVRQDCEPITHEKFPWRQELLTEQWWEQHKHEVGL